MKQSLNKMLKGYQSFRKKYASGNKSIMRNLSQNGQQPEIMIVSCCDSRVDPALILQCDPGDLFVVRNVANIVPPYENDNLHHGTSAALEFGICFLQVKHLILLGHSQCGGIHALLQHKHKGFSPNDFITPWVSQIDTHNLTEESVDDCAKLALAQSYQNCLTFPWIKQSIENATLHIHLWFFDIQSGQIFAYDHKGNYRVLDQFF